MGTRGKPAGKTTGGQSCGRDEETQSCRISETSLGVWGFFAFAHLKDMKMTFTKGIMDLLYRKMILEVDGGH